MTVDMAKSNKSDRMKMKGYPTHRFLRYKLSHTNSNGTDRADDNHYIDLARDISAMNKRKYDQGRLWGVSSFTLHDNQSHIHATIAGLRHVWPTYSAYRMARRVWKKQISASGYKGSWQQFIVALGRDVLTDPDNPLPLDTEEMSCKRGEWMISQLSYALPDGNEANAAVVMTGDTNVNAIDQLPHNTQIGADSTTSGPMFVRNVGSGNEVSMERPGFSGSISASAEWSRARPDVSNSPDDDATLDQSLFAQMLQSPEDYGGASYIDEVLERQKLEGDHPPYAQDLMGLDDSGTNDGLWVYREARFASGQKTIMLPGAEIPLGLLKVVTNGAGNGTCYLDIEVAPGGYKGVHALEV